jgi:hypothetical protein
VILTLLFGLLIVGVAEGAALLYFGFHARTILLAYLDRAEKAQLESLTLLKATREYSRSAHVQRRETGVTLEEVRQEIRAAVCGGPNLAVKVDAVPQKTADLVAEVIGKAGDSKVDL